MSKQQRRAPRLRSLRAGDVRRQFKHHLESLRRQGVSPEEAVDSLAALVASVLEKQGAVSTPASPNPLQHTRAAADWLLADLRQMPARMSVNAARTLHLIGHRNQSTPSELSQTLGVSPAAMTGTVDSLVRSGLVVRREDQEDRRKVVLALTGAGMRLTERIFPSCKSV